MSILDVPSHIRIDNQKRKVGSYIGVRKDGATITKYYLVNEETQQVWCVTIPEAADITGVVAETLRTGNFKKGKKRFGEWSLYSESLARQRRFFDELFKENI